MERFLETYKEVFDNEKKVKNCGREKCIKLIKLASKIDNTKDYGDINTGFMNVENIIELRNSLVHKQ